MKTRSIILFLAFLTLASTCVGGYFYYSIVKDNAFEEARHDADGRLEKIANHINLPLDSYARTARILAGLPAMRTALAKKRAAALAEANSTLDHFQAALEADVCYLMDKNGTTLASSNRRDSTSFVGKNYAFRPYFRKALQGVPAIYMALGVTSRKRGIYFSHPVYRYGGSRPLGAVVVKTAIDEIEKGARLAQEGIVVLTSPNGVVFITNRGDWLYHLLWEKTIGEIEAISGMRQFGGGPLEWAGVTRIGPDEAVDRSGVRYSVHEMEMDPFPGWTLLYLYEHRVIYNEIFDQLFKTSGYIFLILCFFIATLAGFLYRKGSYHILERGKAEKALELSERKYRQVVENASEAIVVIQEGAVCYFNRRMMEISRYSRKELSGKNFLELVHPDDRSAALERYKARTSGIRISALYQMKVLASGGDARWAETSSVMIDWRGKPAVLAFITDITSRKKAEEALKENEAYLKTIMDTIQAGIMITEPDTGKIVDVNPFAARLIGRPAEELLGEKQDAFMEFGEGAAPRDAARYKEIGGDDGLLRSASGKTFHIRRSKTGISRWKRAYTLQSFNDITDINELLNKQEINIELAARLLHLVDGPPPRWIDLDEGARLFIGAISAPCYTLGGDHFFVESLPGEDGEAPARTVISLKDQSGHAVGGVLKCVITDLIHLAMIRRDPSAPLEKIISGLNDEICKSEILGDEDFFTSINFEIAHGSRELRWVSTGHPAFLMIREGEIIEEQKKGEPGANAPIGFRGGLAFTAGELRLEAGDKLILYTDGLTEMPLKRRDRPLSFKDMKGLVEEILQESPGASVSEITGALLSAVADMSGERVEPFVKNTSEDDVTLIGLEIEDAGWSRTMVAQSGDSRQISTFTRLLTAELEKEWRRAGFDAPESRLGTFLEEAILNAWLHGNRRDPDKKITVQWCFGNDFILEVRDEGAGFDPGSAPDPRNPENLRKTSGRGIFIIGRLADEIWWKDGGRRLTARFRRHPDPGEKAYYKPAGWGNS
ncbi:MAG: PAS domain S-box protein [Desulfobacterales bacterium]|nr:PAS domain S-box protein [Desulfobacterales bacterium]